MRRSAPPCSTTYIVPAEPGAPLRNAIATGLDSPETTGTRRTRTVARFAAGFARGFVLDVTPGFLVVVLVVGAIVVGAVDGAECGAPPLLHAASATEARMIPGRTFRIAG